MSNESIQWFENIMYNNIVYFVCEIKENTENEMKYI